MGRSEAKGFDGESYAACVYRRQEWRAAGGDRDTQGQPQQVAFDDKQKIFALKKVPPAGMAFPYDFGFVPSTVAEDGDPTDVLVLMDEPAFPGCLLKYRIIGVTQGEQGTKKDKERNEFWARGSPAKRENA